jgi:hypothetical protein
MSIFLGAVKKSKYTAKQLRAITKVEKLILEAESIFENANLGGRNWDVIYGQTESAINRSAMTIKQYKRYIFEEN